MCCPGAVPTSDLIIFARPSPYDLAPANAFHIVANTGVFPTKTKLLIKTLSHSRTQMLLAIKVASPSN